MSPGAEAVLAGRRVLVPVTAGRERQLVTVLTELGAHVETAELAQIAPPADPAPVAAALARLAAGEVAWLAVTSSHAVAALDTAAGSLAEVIARGRRAVPGSSRIAAVGPATAAALTAIGLETNLLPTTERSARGLLDAWPAPPGESPGGTVLLAQGDLAEPTLASGLSERGWPVLAVVVYRNLPAAPLDAELREALAAGEVDAVVLTSGSVAERLLEQVPGARTAFVALGPRTAEVLADMGVAVAATSVGPDAATVARAVIEAVGAVPASARSVDAPRTGPHPGGDREPEPVPTGSPTPTTRPVQTEENA